MFIKYERGVIVLDTSTIVGLISSLGFPIVSCIAMARYMTKSIDTVLSDMNIKNGLIKAGREQVKKYSWKKMAEETLAVYEKALKR